MKKQSITTRTESVQVIENKNVSGHKLEKVLQTLLRSLPLEGNSFPVTITRGCGAISISSTVSGKRIMLSVTDLKERGIAL